ncbi:hypothetical protein BKA64DRAFT_749989 [Cadophora sp. MPI-SDFR-AT-0126]|nr:hypothetical protein BKA64DRAFT_749989 [Leotiomycetes sp. MPI-SDFR-AT-0126]
MATTAPPSSPIFSFFHMDFNSIAHQESDNVRPTTTVPIADKDLVFVHLNEVTGPTQDTDTRHTVRAHVMRDFQRKKHKSVKSSKPNKRPLRPNPESDTVEIEDQQAEAVSSGESSWEAEILPEEGMELGLLPDPQQIGMLEPFNTLPISGSPRLQLLMHHYNTVLVNTLIPVNPKNEWFNYAITDPALFHATMMHAAMHQRVVSGGLDQREQVQLKTNAIMMVNQRLGDPVLSKSDVTIGAVVCLVLLENQEGNLALSNIHMNGLQKMVALRGGIDNLGLAGVLRRKILWGDILNATISGSEPRFNMTPTAAHPITDFNTFTPSDSIPFSRHVEDQIQLPEPACTCSTQFSTILSSLRSISSQSHLEADITGTLSDNIYLAERHLLYLLKHARDFPSMHSRTCSSLGAACFIAAQMYLYHTLRDYPFEVPVFQMFLQRLNIQLWDQTTGEVNSMWEGKEQMLLWVLSLGALANRGDGMMKARYVREIQRICHTLGVVRLESLVALLSGVVWRDAERDLNLVALWNEVHSGMSFENLGFEELHLGADENFHSETRD